MTATECLREMVDEQNPLKMRWVVPTGGNAEYDTNVINDDFGVFHFSEDPECGLDLTGVTLFGFLTPEKAIEATLGREDTFTREDVESAFVSGYSLGSLPVGSDPRWDENRQTVEDHMAELGWERSRGTCKDVHESPNDGTFWPSPHFKCSKCGKTHVSMEYVYFCPNCGAEVVDE